MDKKKTINVWYDREGDFLEVTWEAASGDFVETKDRQAMMKVDDDGNVLGFHILGLSRFTKPVSIDLAPLSEEEVGESFR